ncbi:glycosyltransferase family 4 protein [Cohaesibacter intestini]|uniref:glycosyltransferase family 4 protein n=1 Tax=Cohaesibacter intestini TaxID=2211145 RepID=UPI000DEBB3AD|nr:glycosyltransferase family 4 protein [Cohaesibacter intestini]
MKISFYAPLKSPNHPTPSGDRLMARMLIEAMQAKGHQVEVISQLRAFTREPDGAGVSALREAAALEFQRLDTLFAKEGNLPDLWFSYHPYYKSPDLLGPTLCRKYAIPYVTLEASHSRRRDAAGWAPLQEFVREAIGQAVSNICITRRDARGLLEANPNVRIDQIKPFLKVDAFREAPPVRGRPAQALATVAMMRPGDKLESYSHLSQALSMLDTEPWQLDIVGDGTERAQVESLFAAFGPERVTFHGQQPPEEVRQILGRSALYLWPGIGEAYGLAYLEAQAMGVPVIAYDVTGVPEVVSDREGGTLVTPQEPVHLAAAIRDLLLDEEKRIRQGEQARAHVLADHSFEKAADRLDAILQEAYAGY